MMNPPKNRKRVITNTEQNIIINRVYIHVQNVIKTNMGPYLKELRLIELLGTYIIFQVISSSPKFSGYSKK